MKLRALVRDPEGIERFLRHQSLWSPPAALAPARAPPYHRSVTRLQPTCPGIARAKWPSSTGDCQWTGTSGVKEGSIHDYPMPGGG
jgi:hypothetical protein